MEPIPISNVIRLEEYLKVLDESHHRPHVELPLGILTRLLNGVGFDGPLAKGGSVQGFSHELLKDKPMLLNGQFTVHIIHGKKVDAVHYRDFKRYMRPYIDDVLYIIRSEDLTVSKKQPPDTANAGHEKDQENSTDQSPTRKEGDTNVNI
jgi:hypothetical protein